MPPESCAQSITIYVTEDGREPFSQWLDSLQDPKARARIRKRIDRVSLGNLGDHKSVGEGVVELREHYGPGYRIYCGLEGEVLVVLLCGGDKDSQEKDIQEAHTYWLHYRRRTDA